MTLISVVSEQCADICAELNTIGQYVSVDKVVQVLLQRYNIGIFDQLGIGPSVLAIPTLNLVWTLERKISSFLEGYYAIRSIVTIASLDKELTVFLKSFNLPSINTMRMSKNASLNHSTDPNELDLDDNQDVGQSLTYLEVNDFNDYCMGPLAAHPIVTLHQSIPSSVVLPSDCPTSSQIVQNLLHYLTDFKCFQFMNEFKVEGFKAYLRDLYGVSDLYLCGVVLQGDLSDDVLALKHVVNKKYAEYARVATAELESLQSSKKVSRASEKTVDSSHHTAQNAVTVVDVAQIRLRPCAEFNASAQSLLERVQEDVNSPYSPSLGKVHRLIMSYCDESQTHASNQGKKGKSRKKQRRQEVEDSVLVAEDEVFPVSGLASSGTAPAMLGDETLKAQLVSAATEFVMLHIGGRKHWSKRVRYDMRDEKELRIDVKDQEEDEQDKQDKRGESETRTQTDSDAEQDLDSASAAAMADKTASAVVARVSTVLESSSSGPSVEESIAAPVAVAQTAAGPMVPPVPKFEGRLHSTLMQGIKSSCSTFDAAPPQYRDSLQCELAVVPSSELRHLLPSVGSCLDLSDVREVGRWGERLVYQYLVSKYVALLPLPTSGCEGERRGATDAGGVDVVKQRVDIQWLNEVEESRAAYDFILTNNQVAGRDRTTYIEVKTTRYSDLNVFELSLWEWEFAVKEPRVPYHIYRVFNAGDAANVRIVIVKDLLRSVSERRIKLCLAV